MKLGTRGSRLALAQAESVKTLLEPTIGPVELEIVRTSGDKGDRDRLGAFVREIQEALVDGRVDLGLHCLKDLPTRPIEGLELAAYLEREDPSDAILSLQGWENLSREATVGTGSLRRSSQLAAIRPDLRFKPLVGNVDTRLRKLMDGEYEAIVVAVAGLKRLGLLDTWSESRYWSIRVQPLTREEMLPAPGQAVLVIECRGDEFLERLQPFDHTPTRAAALAERSFLHAFGGGCSVPVAALGSDSAGSIHLEGLVARPDGSKVIRGSIDGENPVETGESLAARLIGEGALDLFSRESAGMGGGPH